MTVFQQVISFIKIKIILFLLRKGNREIFVALSTKFAAK
jgi:hypothetical protein